VCQSKGNSDLALWLLINASGHNHSSINKKAPFVDT